MTYDFTSVLDRRGKDALAVDAVGRPGSGYPAPREGFDVIPMWIADMSFPVCPTIQQAMIQRIEHPVFGYFSPPEAYYDAIIRWQKERHGVQVSRENIGYENGVLGGLISAMNVICSRGAKVLVHAPTYIGFTASLTRNGYKIVHSALIQDEQGVWRMDYADMEEKLAQEKIHAAVFCSPHNPSGRVWEKWEVEKAMELYRKYDVTVVSDEIWSDIVFEGHRHVPTQSVSEDARNRTVALYAPSKTFNLAGLVGSYHIIYNKTLKERCEAESALCMYNEMNVLSLHALLGAYTPEGTEWVGQMLKTVEGNVDYACRFVREHFDGVSVSKPQGTYILYLNCGKWLENNGKTMDQLLQAGWDVGVMWQDGRAFHGNTYVRMNLALPLSRLKEALDRLDKYVFNS